jgi:hypothetical protein
MQEDHGPAASIAAFLEIDFVQLRYAQKPFAVGLSAFEVLGWWDFELPATLPSNHMHWDIHWYRVLVADTDFPQ